MENAPLVQLLVSSSMEDSAAAEAERVARSSSLHRSVVKIFVRSAAPNWTSPWQTRPQGASTGSGLCLGGCHARQVLTNAHVVRDAVTVRVRRHGDATRYQARVVCSSPQCDLALLEVADDAFWAGIGAIEMTEEVPSLDSDVLTVGYPVGGDNISVTRGVVSRIDLMDYTFSPAGGERQPVIQVDAAINPGNSGGPVLGTHGRAIGVAFAGLKSGENIGYVIPSTVVHFFLRGYREKGAFVGLCSLGIRVQQMQNPALRSLHHLDCAGGVLVVDVAPRSSAAAAGLCAGDVLLAVDGVPVAEDSSVPFRDASSGERIGFDYLVTQKVTGERIELSVLRKGQSPARSFATLDLFAAPLEKLVLRVPGVDAIPSYFVVGGLVFMTLTLPWLAERFRDIRRAPSDLEEKLSEHKTLPDQEVVVLAKVLAAEVNYGYEDFNCVQLLKFGIRDVSHTKDMTMADIRSLKHLRQLVNLALSQESATPAFLCFGLSNDLEVVLEASTCIATRADVLRQHGLPNDCSEDLLAASEASRSRL